ncbi:PhnD/SsuA/transferrin family substrate-binding protein, partial [Azospirillum rugosum]|uniref:PhnD/SsuA/transferrin family substrate-binding protein n=1 Tax=Azospirillum rugosum TaxID=416170 RepID=UPI00361A2828
MYAACVACLIGRPDPSPAILSRGRDAHSIPTGFVPTDHGPAVLAYRGGDHANAAWEPTVRYLAERFPGRGAEMVPLDLPGMDAAVQARSIDFVLTNTGNYVELEARHGVTRIATLHSSRAGESGAAIGSDLIARADRTDIRAVSDLK